MCSPRPDLSEVRNLNLWGNDYSDIRIVRELTNVEVLSLSVNSITTLKDLAYCTQLRELYLRKNKITELSEILYLVNLPHLKILWLSENPCCATPNYREYILSKLPNLQKLDNTDITQEEREVAMKRSQSSSPTIYSSASVNGGGSGGHHQLRPASIDEKDFISPKYMSPTRANHHDGGGGGVDSHFNFRSVGSSSPVTSPRVSNPPVHRPARDFGAVQRSPLPSHREHYTSASALAIDSRDGPSSPTSAARYTVTSPHGSQYPSTSRPTVVPPLNFNQVSNLGPRSPIARQLANELSHDGVGESSEELAAKLRTDALEEEIRILRLAEEAERIRESARQRVSSPPPQSRHGLNSRIRSAHSSPVVSPRAHTRPFSAASPSSVALSPRSSNIASSYVQPSSGSSTARSHTSNTNVPPQHPTPTSNHVYGARPQTARESYDRPPAGEKPNHVPVFARGLLPNQEQSGATSARMVRREKAYIACRPTRIFTDLNTLSCVLCVPSFSLVLLVPHLHLMFLFPLAPPFHRPPWLAIMPRRSHRALSYHHNRLHQSLHGVAYHI